VSEDRRHDISRLDDQKIDDLRKQLRDFVSGVRDPAASMVEFLFAYHGLHTSGHNNGGPPPQSPPGHG
jgi:hypothetical protein